MGPRTLEARLTARLVSLAGSLLLGVGAAAVVVTDRVLDTSDTGTARTQAAAARDALAREIGEGDAIAEAVDEVVGAERAQGVRVAVRRPSASKSPGTLEAGPDLAPGACTTVVEKGAPWRACASESGLYPVVAAVPIASHRETVAALARGMVAVAVVALVLLWWAVRRALLAPADELKSLVGWTERIVDTGRAIDPPAAHTLEIAQLQTAFVALVRRLLEGLARERATSAHIAHELRTPLTAIGAELEGARGADVASGEALLRVRADVARLADAIESILVLSDADHTRRADRAVVNVADLARECAPADACVEAPDEALLEGDERLLTLAMRNLIENAQKYGAGVRLVRVSRDGSAIRLAVIDRGPGLDANARAHMFERYWRGSADGDGSGLGLALVRAVADRHGGRAEALPGPGGQGLEVAINLGRAVGWHD